MITVERQQLPHPSFWGQKPTARLGQVVPLGSEGEATWAGAGSAISASSITGVSVPTLPSYQDTIVGSPPPQSWLTSLPPD